MPLRENTEKPIEATRKQKEDSNKQTLVTMLTPRRKLFHGKSKANVFLCGVWE